VGSNTQQFNSLQGRWRATNYWEALADNSGDPAQVPVDVYGRNEKYTEEEVPPLLLTNRSVVCLLPLLPTNRVV
jgi:hypothetical protein